MADYSEEIDMALELLTEFGGTHVLRSIADGTPADATKPWRPGTAGAPTNTNITAVFLDYTTEESANTLIQTGDQKVYVAASDLAFDPTPKMLVVRSGEDPWKIERVKKLCPADVAQPIMYELQVRR